jgi:hypothetical protein
VTQKIQKEIFMKKKNLVAIKFATVALAVGFFSPSVSVVENSTSLNSGYSVSVSILNTAEARQKAQGSSTRSVNRYYGGGHYHHGYHDDDDHDAAIGLAVGMVVGAAVASSSNQSQSQSQ